MKPTPRTVLVMLALLLVAGVAWAADEPPADRLNTPETPVDVKHLRAKPASELGPIELPKIPPGSDFELLGKDGSALAGVRSGTLAGARGGSSLVAADPVVKAERSLKKLIDRLED